MAELVFKWFFPFSLPMVDYFLISRYNTAKFTNKTTSLRRVPCLAGLQNSCKLLVKR